MKPLLSESQQVDQDFEPVHSDKPLPNIFWGIQHAAAYCQMAPNTYRKHLLARPNHPKPVSVRRLCFHAAELKAWLNNPENLR